MANTTNFGWETPDDTDLVKDGAAAIRTLGSAIDTSMVDLKGGTTGQILSKTSNTDMDFTWITNDVGDITAVTAGTGITGGGTTGSVTITNDMATTITAAGDIVIGTGSGTYDNLPIGTTGQVLTADTTVSPYKVKWATPAVSASGMTFITKNTFSNVANVAINDIFSSAYDNYEVYIEIAAATSSDDIILQVNYGGTIETGNVYYGAVFKAYTTTSQTATQGTNQFTMLTEAGWAKLTFQNVGVASEKAQWHGTGVTNNDIACLIGGYASQDRTYTGINLKSSSTNITGFVTVYGLAKS